MAKLSDRQKNNILAKWNTGSYTKTQLAKTYKVSEKIIRNIVGKEEPSNADIVKAQVQLESLKKSEKSPIEIKAINQAVKYELNSIEYKEKNIRNVHEVANDILIGLQNSVRKGKAQKVITEGQGMGASMGTVIEYDYQPEHYEKSANALYKVGQTYGVVNEKPDVAIQNNIDKKDDEVIIRRINAND